MCIMHVHNACMSFMKLFELINKVRTLWAAMNRFSYFPDTTMNCSVYKISKKEGP